MSNAAPKPLSKAKAKELATLVDQLMQLSEKEYGNAGDYLGHHREMHGLLERIRRLEPKIATTNGRPRMDNVQRFTKWATDNGCVIRGVQIAEQYGGLGLVTTGDPLVASAGEEKHDEKEQDEEANQVDCIQVPRSLFFYVKKDARFRPLLDVMPASMLRERGNYVLALGLIMERFRRDSFWRPYFDVLPDRYTTPLYYKPEDAAELRQTNAFVPALKLCKSIAYVYGFVRKFVVDKVDELRPHFTYDVFRWAVSTVMTRQNNVPVNLSGLEGLDSTFALIPYWDMANHEFRKRSEAHIVAKTHYVVEHERLVCSVRREDIAATQSHAVGIPFLISYGVRTDAQFLVHNGFFASHNPVAAVEKKYTLNPADPLYAERSRVLEMIHFLGTLVFGHLVTLPNDPMMYAVARVCTMDESELHEYSTAAPERRDKVLFLSSPSAYEQVERWMLETLAKLLRNYPTTPEQDEELLRDPSQLHPIRRLLIEYRLAEKRLMQRCIPASPPPPRTTAEPEPPSTLPPSPVPKQCSKEEEGELMKSINGITIDGKAE